MITNPPVGTIIWRVCWAKFKPLLEQTVIELSALGNNTIKWPSSGVEMVWASDRFATTPEEAIRNAFAEESRLVKEARAALLAQETRLNKLASLKAKLDQHQAPKP